MENNAFLSSNIGKLKLEDPIITFINVNNDTINEENLSKLPTGQAISSYVSGQISSLKNNAVDDYTAFEVYPTYNDISAGTVSDIKTIVYGYETGRNYSVGEIILKNDVFYTCKKTIDKTQTVVPTVTDGWEEYWDEGSEHEQDGLYLKYAVDVPACHILQIQIYTHQKVKANNDMVIDWGDGEVTEIAKSGVIYQDYSDQGYLYAGFVVSHNYSEEGKFIVKVFGKDYFMLRCSPTPSTNNIVSRIFDRDLPVASCLKNISSLARNALKLLKVEIPYGYNFKNISNWSYLFSECRNLKKFYQAGGLMSVKPYAYGGMFNNCCFLESNIAGIIKMFQPATEVDGYKGIFNRCKKLYGNVDGSRLWGNAALENIALDTSTCFYECSDAIKRQVPLSWGGVNTEIINKPYRRINDGISQAQEQFKGIYEGLEKNGVIRETISGLDVSGAKPGYVVYYNGNLADISGSSYKYFDVDNVVPGQKFRIQTTLGANLGICVCDHEYLVKSWNSDSRVQISGYSNTFGDINAAYAVLSDEMSRDELEETLLTATRDDPVHYYRTNYVEYSENIVYGGRVEITIPEGGTLLRVSGRNSKSFGISSIGYEYLDKPEQYQLSAATVDSLGGIKLGYVQNGQNYPVQLSNQMAYVNVPWSDVAIESAWYDTPSKNIVIQFNDASKDEISVNVSDLVDVYTADGTTLELIGNTFKVKANVFQPKGDYLSSNALDNYLTKTSADTDYQPKGDYLTKTSADTDYQSKGNYLSSNALNEYYKKSETSSKAQINTAFTQVNTKLSVNAEAIDWLDTLSKSNGRASEMIELPAENYIKYGQYLYSNGIESNYAPIQTGSYACTKFIPITSSDVVKYTGYIRTNVSTKCNQYAVYDKNFNCLSAYTPSADIAMGTYEIRLSDMFGLYLNGTLSDEPKYARFAMLGSNNARQFKIKKTNTPKYFGYIADNIALKFDEKKSEKLEFFNSQCNLSTYITSSGGVSTTITESTKKYLTSPLIKVDPFNMVKVYGYGEQFGSTTRYFVAFYDQTSAYIQNSGYPATGSNTYSITEATVFAPKNAEFMRIGGFMASNLPEPFIKCEIFKSVHDQTIAKLEKDINRLEKQSSRSNSSDEFITPLCEIKNQYIRYDNGKLGEPNKLYQSTDFISIAKGDIFYYSGMVRSNSCGFAIYDDNEDFLSSYLLTSDVGTSYQIYTNHRIDATSLIENYESLGTGKTVSYIKFSNCQNTIATNLKVTRNNGSINAIQLIEKLEDQIQDLSAGEDRKNVLYGKNYLTFGDSYTAARFASWTDPNGRTGFDSPIAYDATTDQWKSYGWHIADRNAMTYVNKAVSGGTLTYAISSDGTPQIANSLARDLTTEASFSQLSGPIASADYITIAYGLNDQKWYSDHWNLCPVGGQTDSVISTMWGAWNTVLSTIYNLNPDVKLGIILTDGGFHADQRSRQLSVAGYWGIPVLDLKGDPQVPLMLGSSSNFGNRPAVNPWIIQKKTEIFRMSATDEHPNPYAHQYRSTVIEDFLRRL